MYQREARGRSMLSHLSIRCTKREARGRSSGQLLCGEMEAVEKESKKWAHMEDTRGMIECHKKGKER